MKMKWDSIEINEGDTVSVMTECTDGYDTFTVKVAHIEEIEDGHTINITSWGGFDIYIPKKGVSVVAVDSAWEYRSNSKDDDGILK